MDIKGLPPGPVTQTSQEDKLRTIHIHWGAGNLPLGLAFLSQADNQKRPSIVTTNASTPLDKGTQEGAT